MALELKQIINNAFIGIWVMHGLSRAWQPAAARASALLEMQNLHAGFNFYLVYTSMFSVAVIPKRLVSGQPDTLKNV